MKTTLLALMLAVSVGAAQKNSKLPSPPKSEASTNFAKAPEGHELASIWNDPEFARRMIGSYGFASEAEPRLTPEEQAIYRDKVAPMLREDPSKAVPILEGLIKP